MHITQLRLQGFKSFVEATDLLIRPGLTGVVGPNGCGKSNLLEALRWVMGETSYKAMRGGAMDDVIFSGTQNRPARNSAAVSVFVDNSARKAPAEFNDEDELEITRLIQRGEGSSYRVNGRDVRAKDVKLLFEDAATGARSHALVRQGQIGEIVNSKPEARRRILEDAAGIAGLHSRRHEAELRLNAAEANLERLADVMGQLDAQLTSLKRQARHAQRYKEISQKLRRLEALVYYLKWQGCVEAVSRAEADLTKVLETVAAETLAETKALNEREALVEATKPLRAAEAEAAAALHRLELAEGELDRKAAQQKARQEELTTALDDARQDLARDRQLIEEGTEITARLDKDITSLLSETEKLGALSDEARGKVERAAGDLEAAERELAQISRQSAEAGAKRDALTGDLKRQQERAKHFTALTQQLEDERDRLSGEIENAGATEIADDIARIAGETGALEATLETDEQALEEARLELERLARTQNDARLDVRSLETEIAMIKKLLRPQNTGGLASIIDAVTITRGYEQALWAVVGDELEMPAVERADQVDGVEITGFWRHLDVERRQLPPGVRPLSEFVTAPPALMARLDQTGVVADQDAVALQAQLHPGQRLVSRSGGLWRWDGFCLTAAGAAAPALRLTERNRLPDLVAAHDEALAALTTSGEAMAATKAVAERLASEVKEARRTMAEMKDRHHQLEQSQRQEAAQVQAGERRLAAIEEGLANAARETSQAADFAIELNLAVAALPPARVHEAALASQQDVTAEVRRAHASAQMEWAALSGREEMNRTRIEEMQGESQGWRARITEAEQHVLQLTARIEKSSAELAKFADLPDQLASQRQALFAEKETAEARHRDAGDELAKAESAAQNHEKNLRRLQAQLMEVREDKARVETRLEGARASLMQIANEIDSELEVKPDGCLELAGLGPEAILPRLSEAEAEAAQLKRDRDRLGAVNLRADDEIKSLEEQFGGMASERDDLTEAVAQLRRAVGQLNEEGRQRLLKAFDVVNGHFKRLFQTLFAGGEASLSLVDSDDPLEAGLEIIARPPGKKPQVLTLLSGGEKALTAMSLIFAVFLTNPSPICVLDEVDAPLDDTNVDRFCVMMEEMARSTDTRFLVITHHPMTMERMDRLFGVTMSEKGVSQLVSVDLATAEGLRESA